MEDITSKIEDITPDKAQRWLDNSETINRSYSKAVIASYAETMKNGNWLLNGEAITFDRNENLLNGHHRLMAVIESGCTIKSFVVRGIDKKAFSTFDCGRCRTFGQLISMQGFENGNHVAASIRIYLTLVNGNPINESGAYNLQQLHETNKTLVDFFKKNNRFFADTTKNAIVICGKARVLPISFVSGSIAYLIRDCGYNFDYVVNFFKQLCCTDTAPNNTINILRKRLFEDSINRKSLAQKTLHQALTIKCWNAFVSNIPIKQFKWIDGTEKFPQYLKVSEIK